jgi:type II secretory pathway pseudopilin PulG
MRCPPVPSHIEPSAALARQFPRARRPEMASSAARWLANRRGFTILEIMVGVGVVGLVLITMYRLVSAQLQALQVSRDAQAQTAAMDGLAKYLQSVLAGLPPRRPDCLQGQNHDFGFGPEDEITWLGRPGLSILTSAAAESDYSVTLTLKPTTATSRQKDLVILRRLTADLDSNYKKITLLSDVANLQFQYLYPQLDPNHWFEKVNVGDKPALVRMKVWRRSNQEAYEVVLSVPSSRIQ